MGFPGINADELAKSLNNRKLPGVRFEPVSFAPRSIPGMSSSPPYQGKEIAGIRIIVTDRHLFQSVETAVHILSTLYNSLDNKERERFFSRSALIILLGQAAFDLLSREGCRQKG